MLLLKIVNWTFDERKGPTLEIEGAPRMVLNLPIGWGPF
jgi:hypothetical protein